MENTAAGIIPILNLQLRPPDTGMMIHPEDLILFREKGIKVVVTCHEFMLNAVCRKADLNAFSLEYFREADRVIFFNEQDRNLATRQLVGLEGKSSLSQVMVPGSLRSPLGAGSDFSIEQRLAAPPNILFFGSLRKNKGFELIPPMAQALVKQGVQGAKIIVVGEPSDFRLVAELLVKSCGVDRMVQLLPLLDTQYKLKTAAQLPDIINELHDIIRALISSGKKQEFIAWVQQLPIELPIEFHFSVAPEQIERLFTQCKYAFACDSPKGFAMNASAMITMLAHGCILFATGGCCTPGLAVVGPAVKITGAYGREVATHFINAIAEREREQRQDLKGSQNFRYLQDLINFFDVYFSPRAIMKGVPGEIARLGLDTVFAKARGQEVKLSGSSATGRTPASPIIDIATVAPIRQSADLGIVSAPRETEMKRDGELRISRYPLISPEVRDNPRVFLFHGHRTFDADEAPVVKIAKPPAWTQKKSGASEELSSQVPRDEERGKDEQEEEEDKTPNPGPW